MKVRLKHVDSDDSKLFYNARSLEITPGSKAIKTPIRALSNGDLRAKAQVPSDITLSSPIAGFHRQLSSPEVTKFLTENAFPSSFIDELENASQKMQHSDIILPCLQPAHTAINDVLTSYDKKIEFLRKIYRIQQEAKMKIFCIPWLDFTPDQYKKVVDNLSKDNEDEMVFYINSAVDPDPLRRTINCLTPLIETEKIHFLGILYNPVRDALNSYDALWEILSEQKVAILLADIERANMQLKNLSASHVNEFILGDIFLPKVYARAKPNRGKVDLFTKFKVFNKNNLTVDCIGNYNGESWKDMMSEDIVDPAIQYKIDHYLEAKDDPDRLSILKYISKVHEFTVSSKEFNKSRDFITREESDVYLEEKPVLKSVLRSEKGIQKKLIK
ncbi:hypothetical protein [Methanoregula formicica]|uniref:Uncharacterized protein n=1 Tax=Methanoregula formicica (strain DSM 22288 / NBRC 105244 / SMSP) TaxID=593750 RepID=L0HHE7_METFS|nr:hypothetical protein [Methanoregula formicica]AGB02514.1 hypothetical protein Metfor_1480 [Methanoregula formicica SMSP]